MSRAVYRVGSRPWLGFGSAQLRPLVVDAGWGIIPVKHRVAVRANRSQVTNRIDGVTALLPREWGQVMHMDESLPSHAKHRFEREAAHDTRGAIVGNTRAPSDWIPFEAVRCDTVQGSFHEVRARNGVREGGRRGRPDIQIAWLREVAVHESGEFAYHVGRVPHSDTPTNSPPTCRNNGGVEARTNLLDGSSEVFDRTIGDFYQDRVRNRWIVGFLPQARRYRDRLRQHSLIDELPIQDESELLFLSGQDLCETDINANIRKVVR
jgi:hypothetical protein